MVALAERKTLRLAVLSALYVAQGVPYGFVTVTLAAWLATRGATEGEVGELVAFSMLPWGFKWIWAPLVDRFSRSRMGRRRPWIVFAQTMLVAAATLLAFAPLGQDREVVVEGGVPLHGIDLELLRWLVLACSVFASLQDVCVDALAVDLLPEKERGFANGLMFGGSYLGVMIGGAVLSTVVGRAGVTAAMLGQALILGTIMLLPLLLRERAGDSLFSLRSRSAADSTARPRLLRDLVRAFSRRSPLVAALLALSALAASQAISAVFTVLVVKKLAWSQEKFGHMQGGLPMIVGLCGSVAGGWLADRLGHKRMVALAALLLGATWIVFGLAHARWADRDVIYTFACAQEFALGTLSAAMFALLMGVSWPAVAASQFTTYMALMNFGRTLGAKFAGPASQWWETPGVFVALGVAQLAVPLLLIAIDPKQNRRELGEGEVVGTGGVPGPA